MIYKYLYKIFTIFELIIAQNNYIHNNNVKDCKNYFKMYADISLSYESLQTTLKYSIAMKLLLNVLCQPQTVLFMQKYPFEAPKWFPC